LRVPLDDYLGEIVFDGQLQSFDKTPEFCCIVRRMPEGACAYDEDVPMMVAEDYSIACSPWIALRGSVKIELDEILWGRRPKGGAARRDGGRRGGESLKRRERCPMPEDGEFRGRAG
jgi:hypothetical protein